MTAPHSRDTSFEGMPGINQVVENHDNGLVVCELQKPLILPAGWLGNLDDVYDLRERIYETMPTYPTTVFGSANHIVIEFATARSSRRNSTYGRINQNLSYLSAFVGTQLAQVSPEVREEYAEKLLDIPTKDNTGTLVDEVRSLIHDPSMSIAERVTEYKDTALETVQELNRLLKQNPFAKYELVKILATPVKRKVKESTNGKKCDLNEQLLRIIINGDNDARNPHNLHESLSHELKDGEFDSLIKTDVLLYAVSNPEGLKSVHYEPIRNLFSLLKGLGAKSDDEIINYLSNTDIQIPKEVSKIFSLVKDELQVGLASNLQRCTNETENIDIHADNRGAIRRLLENLQTQFISLQGLDDQAGMTKAQVALFRLNQRNGNKRTKKCSVEADISVEVKEEATEPKKLLYMKDSGEIFDHESAEFKGMIESTLAKFSGNLSSTSLDDFLKKLSSVDFSKGVISNIKKLGVIKRKNSELPLLAYKPRPNVRILFTHVENAIGVIDIIDRSRLASTQDNLKHKKS